MSSSFGSTTKTSFQKVIKQKQALFNRFKRRYNTTKNPGERSFIKGEARRLVTELRQCNSQWKNCGFGASTWITRNYNTANFSTSGNRGKTTSRNSSKSRRTSSRSRSTPHTSYVAW